MINKIKGILGSIRFWVITLGWLAAYLAGVEKEGFIWSSLMDQVALWLGSVAVVGSADSIAERINKK